MQPKTLGLGTVIRPIRLQPNANRPSRHSGHRPRKTEQSRLLVPPRGRRMVPRTRLEFVPVLHSVDLGDPTRTHLRHLGLVSYQGHHAPCILQRPNPRRNPRHSFGSQKPVSRVATRPTDRQPRRHPPDPHRTAHQPCPKGSCAISEGDRRPCTMLGRHTCP